MSKPEQSDTTSIEDDSKTLADLKAVNAEKYHKIITELKVTFPSFDFSEVKIDYSITPSVNVSTNKQLVKCPIHGWFNVHLNTMRRMQYGCSKCGYAASALRNKANYSSKIKVGVKETSARAVISVGTQRLSWAVPKRIV